MLVDFRQFLLLVLLELIRVSHWREGESEAQIVHFLALG
jgi:hypothetical protein